MSQIRMQNHFGAVKSEERYYVDADLLREIKQVSVALECTFEKVNSPLHIPWDGYYQKNKTKQKKLQINVDEDEDVKMEPLYILLVAV